MLNKVKWCWSVDKLSTGIFISLVTVTLVCILTGNYSRNMLASDVGTLYGILVAWVFTKEYYEQKINKQTENK